MRDVLVVVAAVALFAALEAAYHLARFVSDRRSIELRRRLQAVGRTVVLDAEILRRGRLARNPAIAAILAGVPGTRRLERLLEQADSGWSVAHLLLLSAGASAVGAALGVTLRLDKIAVLGLGLAGFAAPFLSVLAERAKRSRKLSEQLPEALDMMSRSLRAGHAISAAFQVVASEMPEPICVEFARAYDEQRMGLTLERAVVQMAGRSPSNRDLKIFAVSAVIQRETGGNLAEILEKIGDTIRQRYRFYGKLRALTGEGRASAVILGALPFGVAVALSVMSPGYLIPLFETDMGRNVLIYALTSWAAGLFWLYRMTQLEI